jgi:hypothetical protein
MKTVNLYHSDRTIDKSLSDKMLATNVRVV